MTHFADAAYKRRFISKRALALLILLGAATTAQALPRQASDAEVKRRMQMKLIKSGLIVAQLFVLLPAHADTHPEMLPGVISQAPNSSCQAREIAEGEARDLAVNAIKTYCRSEGFGWRAASVKNLGKLDCRPCGGNRTQCGYSGVALECRKAEPQASWLGWLSARR